MTTTQDTRPVAVAPERPVLPRATDALTAVNREFGWVLDRLPGAILREVYLARRWSAFQHVEADGETRDLLGHMFGIDPNGEWGIEPWEFGLSEADIDRLRQAWTDTCEAFGLTATVKAAKWAAAERVGAVLLRDMELLADWVVRVRDTWERVSTETREWTLPTLRNNGFAQTASDLDEQIRAFEDVLFDPPFLLGDEGPLNDLATAGADGEVDP